MTATARTATDSQNDIGLLIKDATQAAAAIDALYLDAAEAVHGLVTKDGKLSASARRARTACCPRHSLGSNNLRAQSVREMLHYAERMISEPFWPHGRIAHPYRPW